METDLDEETDEEALIRFSVRDTGIGVPADKRDALFARFTRVDGSTSRKYGGTGLGLAISRLETTRRIRDPRSADLIAFPGRLSRTGWTKNFPAISAPRWIPSFAGWDVPRSRDGTIRCKRSHTPPGAGAFRIAAWRKDPDSRNSPLEITLRRKKTVV
ncbi:MAG: hypothetical protein GY859_35630 [Desulfobacterales bacterium]|nr:hypothetical protein [Desulfobacterales bacterium]